MNWNRCLKPALAGLVLASLPAGAATFSELASEPFGTFSGTEFVRHTGRFEGTTSLGDYSVPFEVVAPADPAESTGTVLFEAPQWSFAPFGRDLILGRNTIFNRGIGYAAVGFGVDGGNILDPTLPDLMIAGAPVPDPGAIRGSGPTDLEIITQFVEAMRAAPQQVGLAAVDEVYAYGLSRSADALMAVQQIVTGTEQADLFDLTLLHSPSFDNFAVDRPAPPPGGLFDALGGAYVPPADVGRVMFVMTEGDRVVFEVDGFRDVVGMDGYRLYEVAGAAHLPNVPQLGNLEIGDNPLDHFAVMSSVFAAGHDWMRRGIEPPASALLAPAPAGEVDPVYGFETGIARDPDGNALGGIRLPDLAAGRALFIASDPESPNAGFPFTALTGSRVDLECEPAPDGGERFDFRRVYDWQVALQALDLMQQGFLLKGDGIRTIFEAVDAEVGRDARCAGDGDGSG